MSWRGGSLSLTTAAYLVNYTLVYTTTELCGVYYIYILKEAGAECFRLFYQVHESFQSTDI